MLHSLSALLNASPLLKHLLQEACRLAETFAAGAANSAVQHLVVGPAAAGRKGREPASFFGSGTVETVAAQCRLSSPSRCVCLRRARMHACMQEVARATAH